MRDLPGFAWDEKRRRYYRILKSGQAPHTSARSWTMGELATSERECRRRELNSKPLPNLSKTSGRNSILSSQRHETSLLGEPRVVSNVQTTVLASHGHAIWGGSLGGGLICISPRRKRSAVISLDGAVVGVGEMISVSRETGSMSLFKDRLLILPPSASVVCQHSTHVGTEKGIFSLDTDFWKTKSAVVAMTDGIIGLRNGQLATWDRRTPSVYQWMQGHISRPTHIEPVGPSQFLISGLEDRMALYDGRMQTKLHEFSGYHNWSNPYLGLSLNPTGTSVAASTDSHVKVWDIQSGLELPLPNKLCGTALTWIEDGIFFGCNDGLRVSSPKPPSAWLGGGADIQWVARAFAHMPSTITQPSSVTVSD